MERTPRRSTRTRQSAAGTGPPHVPAVGRRPVRGNVDAKDTKDGVSKSELKGHESKSTTDSTVDSTPPRRSTRRKVETPSGASARDVVKGERTPRTRGRQAKVMTVNNHPYKSGNSQSSNSSKSSNKRSIKARTPASRRSKIVKKDEDENPFVIVSDGDEEDNDDIEEVITIQLSEDDDDDDDDDDQDDDWESQEFKGTPTLRRTRSTRNQKSYKEESSDSDKENVNDNDQSSDDTFYIPIPNIPEEAIEPPGKKDKGKKPAMKKDRKGKKNAIQDKENIDIESVDTEPISTTKTQRASNGIQFKKTDEKTAEDSGDDFIVDSYSASDDDDDEDEDEDEGGEEEESRTVSTVRRARRPRTQSQEERELKAKEIMREESRKSRQINEWLKIIGHHPELDTVWDDLREKAKNDTGVKIMADQPRDVLVNLLPFQREGLHWLLEQEKNEDFKGGILADEMGMGKTIQTISLLVSKRMKPNLIICPTVAIMQWYSELQNRTTPGLFKILIYHGTNRPKDMAEMMEYDIVLSTYSLVEIEFRKQNYGFTRKKEKVYEKSLLHSIEWKRVILDEAHCIKDRSCATARATFALKRQIQWSLTGTPLQNRVGELYSLIRFMQADPFSYYFCKSCPCKTETWAFKHDRRHCDECGHISHQHFCWWNYDILKPIQKFGATGDGVKAFNKLGLLLDRIMLRRTKIERTRELGLPPRVIRVRRDYFSGAEEELYDSLYSDSARKFGTYVNNDTVLNNYASIFSLLSRMRLAVNHPDLVTTKMAIANKNANEHRVCGICHDIAEDPIISKCHHVFCREDIRQFIETSIEQVTKCPTCFRPLTIDISQREMEDPKGNSGNTGTAPSSIVNYIDMSKWRSSTKIEALVEELTSLQRNDSTSKSIVFSQFVAFLDLIHWRLSRAGFNVVKLDGRMGPQQRDAVIKLFMTDPTVTVFLVSLKAGGVALNLTEASNVFVMDPWWNPAVEDQAFDRIHRLGQYRPIKITRMIIENSIESRILQLQEKKQAVFASTVGKDMNALARLSEDDLQFLFIL